MSGASGYTSRVINAGKINNKGIEVLLYGTPVRTKDFSWDLTLNFAKNTNEVLDLPEGLDKIQLAAAPFGGAYINAVEGATFQEILAYDFVYDDNGNKVVDGSGMYMTSGELTSVGSVLPDYYGTPSATSIFDASYVKLREVTLGYTFPKLIDVVESVRLSVYGRNLAVWGLDNKGIDPETVVGGSGNIQGLEGGIIPSSRSFGFNLKINF